MKRAWPIAAGLLTAGCAGHQQSVVNAAGPESDRIVTLFWFFFGILGLIFAAVLVTLVLAVMRRSRGIEQEPLEVVHAPSAATEKNVTRNVRMATITTVVILFVMLIASVSVGRAVSRGVDAKNAMTIEVTGNQWWWSFRYVNDNPSLIVTTANEIHIPVGRPILIRGLSGDVIHSFWVPNLNGKRDLIPSRVTTEYIQADRPGRYRGQCAEFCGLQHAHMAFWVVAEPANQFDAWMHHQLQPAADPTDPVLQQGEQVFLNNACVFCHAIGGTRAAGQVAPDLTHFGSRISIAAGTLPNTTGNLAGWIVDPQNIKPGNHMASIALRSEDIQPLVNYLESLK